MCGTQTNVSAREPKQTLQVRPLTRENNNAHKYQESCVWSCNANGTRKSSWREQVDAFMYRKTCLGIWHRTALYDHKQLLHLKSLFFLTGTSWSLNPHRKRREEAYSQLHHLQVLVLFPPPFVPSPPLPTSRNPATLPTCTETRFRWNEASHTIFVYCCRTGCCTQLCRSIRGSAVETYQGPSTPVNEDEGPDLKTFGMHAHCVVWH